MLRLIAIVDCVLNTKLNICSHVSLLLCSFCAMISTTILTIPSPLAAAVLAAHDNFVHGKSDVEMKPQAPPRLLSSIAIRAGDKKTF
jgi:hypothetical protein